MMLRAASLLLLLLAVLPKRASFKFIRPSKLQSTALTGSQAYISGWPHAHSSARQGFFTARQSGKAAKTLSPTVLSNPAHRPLLLCGSHTVLYAQEVHDIPFEKKNRSAECVSVSRPVRLPWEQHLVGVWHFYLPSSVYTASNISTEPNPHTPLPVWISEDGSISCPDLKCEGTIRPRRRSSVLDSPDCELALRMTPNAPDAAEIELQGIMAYSSSPVVSLWNNRVQLHAAVAAGAVFVHPLQGKISVSSGTYLPDNVEIRDSSGRIVLSGSSEASSSHVDSRRGEKAGRGSSKAAEYVGNFTAYRILGEDHNELRIRHAFLEFGPQRIYNLVNPDDQEAVHAFFGVAGGLVTWVRNAQLRCDSPRGRTFDLLKERLAQIAVEREIQP